MPRKNATLLWIGLTVGLLLMVAGTAAGYIYWSRVDDIRKMTVGSVDLQHVPNGAHRGQFETPYSTIRVVVHVADHTIREIRMEQDTDNFISYYDRKARSITDRVVRAQDTTVDVVSGATVSSKAVLKAIQNALKQDG